MTDGPHLLIKNIIFLHEVVLRLGVSRFCSVSRRKILLGENTTDSSKPCTYKFEAGPTCPLSYELLMDVYATWFRYILVQLGWLAGDKLGSRQTRYQHILI